MSTRVLPSSPHAPEAAAPEPTTARVDGARLVSDVVGVKGRFTRSVHIERDFEGAGSGYHFTPSAYEVLKAVAVSWEQPGERAMTLVGPYGAGKSAFCVFLAQLASAQKTPDSESEQAEPSEMLRERDAGLWSSLCAPERRLLPILLVGARQALAPALVAGLTHALESGGHRNVLDELRRKYLPTLEAAAPSPRAVADLYAHAAGLATCEGFGGLLLIVDELGKYLEHAALHPREGDILVLQELAEAAARSPREASAQGAPLFVLAALHQSAEAYASKLGRAHQAEWAKVGERFRQVPFFPSDTERMDMAALALDPRPGLSAQLEAAVAPLARDCAPLAPPGLPARFEALALASYPLHPLVLLALPALFRRTGQSHRSLFSFLAGEEAHALGRFARETRFSLQSPPLFMLDELFDYAAQSLLGGWSAGSLARSWADATDAIDRALGASLLARRLLKCIALLGLLRDPRLPASPQVLALALRPAQGQEEAEGAPDVEAALEELRQKRLVAFSRAHNHFRLFEGGDVDVEAEMAAARASLGPSTALRAANDPALRPASRLIARRHSYQTGTLRAVESRACSHGELPALIQSSPTALRVLLCLAASEDEAAQAEAVALRCDAPGLLIAVARETPALCAAADDVALAQIVFAQVPALQGDRAARRELEARRFEAQSLFRDEWSRLFAPNSPADSEADGGADGDAARWFCGGQPVGFEGARGFAEWLSLMADRTFPDAPILRNELVNRRSLSSSAAAARRALIEAMLLHTHESRLGLKGFPPELSMYECLLRATGLHRPGNSGASGADWEFGAPPASDPAHLGAVWREMERTVFGGSPEPCPLPQLWSTLAAPPLGLSEGVMPPLLLAFLLAHPNETTLYRESTFVAAPTVADWEVLLRRPEMFAVAGCRLEGERLELVQHMARGFECEPFLVPTVRELLARARRLPAFSWKTASLPPQVLALRAAIEGARSPEKLLLRDIPLALGLAASPDDMSGENANEQGALFEPSLDAPALLGALQSALEEWSRAMPQVLAQSRDALLQACALPPGDEGWSQFRSVARRLDGPGAPPGLAPLLGRAAMVGDEGSVLEAVLAQVVGRAPRSWSDADVERFPHAASRLGQMWREEARHHTAHLSLSHLGAPDVPLNGSNGDSLHGHSSPSAKSDADGSRSASNGAAKAEASTRCVQVLAEPEDTAQPEVPEAEAVGRGEAVAQAVTGRALEAREAKRAREIAERIRGSWRGSSNPPTPRVAREALLLLLREVEAQVESERAASLESDPGRA